MPLLNSGGAPMGNLNSVPPRSLKPRGSSGRLACFR
jgi:hypothetical protein